MGVYTERKKEMKKMKSFSDDASCPKCGSKMITTKYESGAGGVRPFNFAGLRGVQMATGAMRRTCERCGYRWHERPLDAEKDTPS
jgi:C4-type Zn-finger protein